MKLQILACALFLCSVYAAAPTFSDQYVVKGFYQLPYFNMSQPFEFAYDKTNNRQKWNFYQGLDTTLYFYNQNKVYSIGPNVDHLQCTSTTADQADFPTLTSVFPDLTSGWNYAGVQMVRGINCNTWKQALTNEYNHTDYYYLFVDKLWNTPVQLYMDGINYLFGSHQDIYIFDFISYVPMVSDKDFEVPALCNSKKVHINAVDDQTETGKTSNVAMRGHFEAIRKGKTFFRGLEELRVKMHFDAFVKTHNRKYVTGEEKKRFTAFRNNFYYIEEHNKKNLGFTLKMNKFGDMSDEEFRSVMLRNKKATKRVFANKATSVHPVPSSSSAPQAIDWRDYGAVTMVKDQASCGSCWTFGSTGSLEGVVMLKTGKLVSLSEQQLVDCSRDKYGNAGCGGGFASGAYQWIIDNGGIATEASYPYLGQNSFCNANDKGSGISISGYVNVSSFSEDALHDAVGNVGPVAVAIDASHPSFRFYDSGVYYEPQCGSGMDALDHEVLAVGYGSSEGKDYWIVKNSWSTKWGNDGYIWMARNNNNNCGIASQATYPLYP